MADHVGSVSLGVVLDNNDFINQINAIGLSAAKILSDSLAKGAELPAKAFDTSGMISAINVGLKEGFSGMSKEVTAAIKDSTKAIDFLSDRIQEGMQKSADAGAAELKASIEKAASVVKMPKLDVQYSEADWNNILDTTMQKLDLVNASISDQQAKVDELRTKWEMFNNAGQADSQQATAYQEDLMKAETALNQLIEKSNQYAAQARTIDEKIAGLVQGSSSVAAAIEAPINQATYSFNLMGERIKATSNDLLKMANDGKIGAETLRAGMQSLGFSSSDVNNALMSTFNTSTSELDVIAQNLKKVTSQAASAGKNLADTGSKGKTAGNVAAQAMNEAAKKTREVGKSAGSVSSGFKNLTRLGLGMMGIRSIMAGVRKITQSVGESLKAAGNQFPAFGAQMNGLSQQIGTMKGAFGAMAIPLLEMVMPALQKLVSWATTAFNAIAKLFGAIAGKKTVLVAADSTQRFTDAAKDSAEAAGIAAKANEKLKRSLASFDEIEILPSQKAEESGSGGGSGGGGVGASGPVFQEASTELGDWQEKAQSLTDWFDRLKIAAQPTVEAFGRFKEALEPLKTFTFTAIGDFYKRLLVPIGEWTLGVGIPRFLDALGSMVQNIDWGKINDGLRNLWDKIAPFAIKIGEGLLWFWESVLVPLGTWTMNEVVPRFIEILSQAIGIINDVIDAAMPGLEWLWNNILVPFAEWTGGVITNVLDEISESLTIVSDWVGNNQPLIENMSLIIGSFAVAWGLVTAAIGIWNVIGVIATGVTAAFGAAVAFLTSPIGLVVLAIGAVIAIGVLLYKNWDKISAWLKETWESIKQVASNTWNAISDFFKSLWNGIKETAIRIFDGIKNFILGVWEGIKKATQIVWDGIKAVVTGIWDGIKNAFQSAVDLVSGIMSGLWDSVKRIWDNIKGIFSGIIDFITGVFTGNWSKAWDGIVSIFRNIIDGIANIFKIPINFIIDALNWFIRGLNKIRIPDWVPGIGGFGINIGEIPRLATGGVIDQPTLAMVGEAGKEAVMPLERNTGWIDQLAEKLASKGGNDGGGDVHITMPIYLMGEHIDTIIEHINRRGRQANEPLLEW